MLPNPFAGETAFPLAGERVIIKFRSKDIVSLHTKYGPDPKEPPRYDDNGRIIDHFWSTLTRLLDTCDPVAVMDCLRAGLKFRREDDKLYPIRSPQDVPWDWDDIPFTFEEAAGQLSSGLIWSRWGMTPAQLAEKMREQAAAIEEAGQDAGEDPTIPPSVSTTQSESSGSDTSPV